MKRLRKIDYADHTWKSNPNAVYVGRGKGEYGKWGNPFTIKEYGLRECLKLYRRWLINMIHIFPDFLEPLRGKDLVCYCPILKNDIYHNCHADILISMANNISMEEVKNENINSIKKQT